MFTRNDSPRRELAHGSASLPLSPAPVQQTVSVNRETDRLTDYWTALWRRKWILLLCALAGAALAVLLSLRQTPVYRAHALLDVQTPNENFLNARDVSPTSTGGEQYVDSYIQAQSLMISDEGLLLRVVRSLRLNEKPGFGGSEEKAVKILRSGLLVRPIPQTRLLNINYDSTDPKLAAEITNEISHQVIQQNIEMRTAEARRSKAFLEGQAANLQHQLESSEGELQAYALRSGLLYTGDKKSVAEDKLRSIQSEQAAAEADRIAKESQYKVATEHRRDSDTLPQALTNPEIQQDQAKLTELKRQRAELLSLLTPTNYKVRKLDAQIAEVEGALQRELKRLVQRIKNDYEAASNRERMLSQAYTQQAKTVTGDSVKAIHYSTLLQQVDTTRALHASLMQRAEEASVAAALNQGNISLLTPAVPPLAPYKPNLRLNVVLGLFAGLFAGVTSIGLSKLRDRTFRSPGEPAHSLQIRELGVIPSAQLDPAPRNLPRIGKDNPSLELVTWQRNNSLLAESFRGTLTSLFFARDAQPAKVVAVTSPSPHDGKTTLVSNLGIALAETGTSVLLINGDLRQPQLQSVFKVESRPGLTDLLAAEDLHVETALLDPYIRPTQIANLSIIPSGSIINNIAPLLYSDRLPVLVNRLRREYSVILFDTPPCLHITDARTISRVCDGVVLVFRAGHTVKDLAAMVADRFRSDNIPILGSILNDWDPRTSDPVNSSAYSKIYSHYYKTART